MKELHITKNLTFGQFYIELSEDPTTNIRVPVKNVSDFLTYVELNDDELTTLDMGETVIITDNPEEPGLINEILEIAHTLEG